MVEPHCTYAYDALYRLLFATGLFLSVYRDRLLALPDQIKRREGIFKILSWR